jgi:hypothetical protein
MMSTRAKLAVSGGVLFVSLAAAELFLQLAYPASETVRYIPDPDVGYRLARSQQVFVTNDAREFQSVFITNAAGNPGVDRPLQKPAGTYRIAVLGDSFVEAAQVPFQQSFTTILESRLREAITADPHVKNVEVLNFGTAGYGTAQEWVLYRSEVRGYQPDLVLVAFLPANDVRNNSFQLEVIRAGRDEVAPFYRLRGDRLELQNETFYDLAAAKYAQGSREGPDLSSRIRLLGLALNAYRQVRRWTEGSSAKASNPELEVARELFEASVQETSPEWQEAWNVTRALFEQFKKDVESDHAAFYVVVLPGPCAVEEACKQALLREAQGRQFDWLLPQRMANHILAEAGVPSVNLTEPLRQEAGQVAAPLNYPRDGHLTPEGHKAVARHLIPIVLDYVTRRSGEPVASSSKRSREITQ